MNQGLLVEEDVAEKRKTTVGFRDEIAAYSDANTLAVENRLIGLNPQTLELPRILPDLTRSVSAQEFLIRAFDVLASLAMLIFAAPALLATFLLIKIFSPGPAIFRQQRVGKDGRLFMLYKFRTMIEDAEKHTGPVLAVREDNRVTNIGRFLRATRLDELPQLVNVISGEMSLVGPRPERPYFVKRHRALQGVRLSIRPGLTGLAQIRGFYDTKPDRKLRYDYIYIKNRCVKLNLSILLRTIPVVLFKRGW